MHIWKRRDDHDDLRDCQSRAPLFFENIKAYASIAVDIGVEDLRLERHLKEGGANIYSINITKKKSNNQSKQQAMIK
jgi:hypothetical protein